MEQLVKNSLLVYPGMIAVCPQYAMAEKALYLSELIPKFNGRFSVNNSTVSFIKDSQFFVTPYTRRVIKTLKENGFAEDGFCVPFSNWDYPKLEKRRWDELQNLARIEREREFSEDCLAYSQKHGIGPLSDKTLENCIEVPSTGILYKRFSYKDTYYPIISHCLDVTAVERLGRYNTNNGVVVFVYQNGKTMLTRGYGILDELEKAGYRRMGLFVPFSNWEEFVDPTLKARWEQIKKQ